MSTDRELLKLAAKAAGMQWIDDCKTGLTIQRAEGSGVYNFHWNPLVDDGAALRLANKLRINIYNGDQASTVCGRSGISGSRVDVGSDADAATRRAIVLAASEIGRAHT